MTPFENVHAQDKVDEEVKPKRAFSYGRTRDERGKFVTGILNMHEGVSAEDVRVETDERIEEGVLVSKALFKPPTLGSMGKTPERSFKMRMKPLQPSKPKMPKPAVATVPQTKTLTPKAPRVRQTGIGKSLVAKALTKEDKRNAATLGVGAAAGSVSVAHNRVGNELNRAKRNVVQARINQVNRSYGYTSTGRRAADPRASMPKDAAGRTQYNSSSQRRAVRSQAAGLVKNKHRKLAGLNAHKAKPLVSGSGRSKILLGGAAVGIPATWAGARGLVDKRDYTPRKRDVDAGMVGAAAGAGGYQAAGYALKPLDRRAEARIKADPVLQARAKAYQQSSGRPKNAKAGDPAWRSYFRNYPKDLPGGRLKRTLARTHTGKSGIAATAAAGAAGALGVAAGSRKLGEKRVRKSMPDQSAVHVIGNDGGKRKVLRPRYSQAIRKM